MFLRRLLVLLLPCCCVLVRVVPAYAGNQDHEHRFRSTATLHPGHSAGWYLRVEEFMKDVEVGCRLRAYAALGTDKVRKSKSFELKGPLGL